MICLLYIRHVFLALVCYHQRYTLRTELEQMEETKMGRDEVSRRHVIGDPSFDMAVNAIDSFLAYSVSLASSSSTGESLRNPTDKYPRPPFNKQSQPWPGLASKMDPRPDHGENSYRGSGRLTGEKRSLLAETPEWAGPRRLLSHAKVRT